MTMKQISAHLNVSYAKIIYNYRKYNIKLRCSRKRTMNEEEKNNLIDLYVNKKLGTVEIGKILGIAPTSVHLKLLKYEIPRRSVKESLSVPCSQEKKDAISKGNTGKKRTESQRASRRGPNAYNWKGGKQKFSDSIRRLPEYAAWRTDCFRRDKYACQLCNKRASGTLQVDHIHPMWMIIKENNLKTTEDALKCEILWDTSNGRTLCFECHKGTDSYGWKSKKQKRLLEESSA